jgi:hypothetical protein
MFTAALELWNSKEYIELRAAATRGAKLNTGLIVNVSDAEQANTDMDVDVDDAVDHFLGGTVASLGGLRCCNIYGR